MSMPRSVAPQRVQSLQAQYLRRQGATPQEIRRWLPLLTAQIGVESNFHEGVGSPAGARDIAQFIPSTARSYGVTLGDNRIKDDIRGQVRYMLPLLRKYGGEGALRAYNAGPGAIQASHGYSETNAYVSRILGSRGQYRGKVPGGSGRGASGGGSGAADALALLHGGGGSSAVPQGSEGIAGLLAALNEKAPVQSAGLQAPAFSAAPAMPEGAQLPPSGGGPAPKPDVSALLDAIRTVGGDAAGGGGGGITIPGAAGKAGTGGMAAPGNVRGRSAASLVNHVIGYAQTLGLQPGSRNRSAAENAAVGGASGSDHLIGPGHEAIDLPTTPQQGGWKQYRKIVQQLGLKPASSGFTEGFIERGGRKFKVQVIFGAANDHGDHIHVGFHRA